MVMLVPGEWIDSRSPLGGYAPQPNRVHTDSLNIKPRAYHPSEKLSPEFWDDQRLAEHVSAVMPSDCAPAAVDFILKYQITGTFLINYTHWNEIDEMISGNKCELIRRIADIVPFWVPRRGGRFTSESYCLRKLAEQLDSEFSFCVPPMVSEKDVEEYVFDWGDESPSPSALAPDSERPNPDPAEGAGHLLPSVEHAGQPQLEYLFPLTVALPQTSLGHDIFTCPTLLPMGFLHDISTAPALSQPAAQMSTTRAIRSLAQVRSADNDEMSSGSNTPRELTSRSSEGGRRVGRTSAAVVPGCSPFCFGAGVFAPLQDLPRRLLAPRTFAFSPRQLMARIEEIWPDQAGLAQSHIQ